LHNSGVWNIYLNDDCAVHNAYKDEDQNIDLPCGQLIDNVEISESSLELEQVNVNFLEAIQYSGIRLVWYNMEYERSLPFYIRYWFYACCA
jgi:hypothetical protein